MSGVAIRIFSMEPRPYDVLPMTTIPPKMRVCTLEGPGRNHLNQIVLMSDEGGDLESRGLPPGEYRVQCGAAEKRVLLLSAETETVSFRLP